ncbi:MAG: carotenoid biosynthesis protein [Deltaproteobacteria bacterium]|nr:carotenoid biosynthesis protein [Deltaproteobacteria bacterium]
MAILDSLLITLTHRPYIFLFLAGFLVTSGLSRGGRQTFLFLLIGYTVALASEASSIRNGFPYGRYFYLYENMPGETMVFGVPLWDSLSYVFMAYASLAMAEFLHHFPLPLRWGRVRERVALGSPSPSSPPIKGGEIIFSASLLMVVLDLLADPLAYRGDRWFLGKIYDYASPGLYFGIPLSNFAGWFLVALVIFSVFSWVSKKIPLSPPLTKGETGGFTGPLLYGAIVLFNLTLTLWIGEFFLALCGVFWLAIGFSLIFFLSRRRRHG